MTLVKDEEDQRERDCPSVKEEEEEQDISREDTDVAELHVKPEDDDANEQKKSPFPGSSCGEHLGGVKPSDHNGRTRLLFGSPVRLRRRRKLS